LPALGCEAHPVWFNSAIILAMLAGKR